eukprot:2814042-Rhodomonas_salina.5
MVLWACYDMSGTAQVEMGFTMGRALQVHFQPLASTFSSVLRIFSSVFPTLYHHILTKPLCLWMVVPCSALSMQRPVLTKEVPVQNALPGGKGGGREGEERASQVATPPIWSYARSGTETGHLTQCPGAIAYCTMSGTDVDILLPGETKRLSAYRPQYGLKSSRQAPKIFANTRNPCT